MHAFIVPIRSLQDHTPLPGKPIWLPGPLPWRDPTRSPYPKAPELMGEAGAWPPWAGMGPWKDLVLTIWVNLSNIQDLSDLSLVTCKTE